MAVLKDLIVHGPSRFINTALFDELEADTGKFRKLATKILGSDGETITVYGLMDVQGELHTKSWSNSNIATIDGSFYICPTLVVPETGTSTTNILNIDYGSTVSNEWTIKVTASSIATANTIYTMDANGNISNGRWNKGSKVAITGEVLIDNEWVPLGTIRGRLYAYSGTTSVTISYIHDGYSNTSNNILSTIGARSNLKHRNVKISLYEWTLSDSSTPSTASTNPIGIYMTALGDGTGQTIIDIYGGTNVASSTYKGLALPNVRIGNLSGLSGLTIAGQNPKGWGIYTSNGYFEGTIAARRGFIGNATKYWTIGTSGNNSTIYNGPSTVSATSTAGTYLGTDGFLNAASSTTYAQITGGVLTAQGAVIKGALTATSLATGNPARTGTGTGTAGTYIASDGAIYVGSNNDFTVTAAGVITAKSGTIGGWSINSSYGIYTNSKTSATSTNSGILIQKDGNIYAGAYNSTVASCPFQVTNTGILTAVNANLKGLTIYDSNGKKRAGVTTSGFIVYDGASATTTTSIAEFGSYINIGTNNNNNSKAGTAVIGTGLEISSQLDATSQTQTIVGKYNLQDIYAQFLVGIGTSASNRINAFGVSSTYGQQILEIFEGNGSSTQMTTSFNIDTTQSITAYQIDNSSITYTATASSSNTKKITFTTAPTNGTQVCVYYTTTDNNGYIYTSKNIITGRGAYSFSQGEGEALGYASHAYGQSSTTSSIKAEGIGSLAHGETQANNYFIRASGSGAIAGGAINSSGHSIIASGPGAIAQGYTVFGGSIIASGTGSFAIGNCNGTDITASGTGAVAGGWAYGGQISASSSGSIAYGYSYSNSTMKALNVGSVALNESTHAIKRAQLAIGSYNADDPASSTSTTHSSGTTAYGTYAFIIGNGTGESARSNALTVDWQGNLNTAGSVSSKTEEYVPTLPSTFTATAVHVFRKSGVVSINIVNIIKSSAGSTTLFTLPEGWRAPEAFAFLIGVPNAAPKYRLSTNEAGTVSIYNYGAATTAATNVSGTCTFVTA